jgi:hypothetical protein
MNKVTMILATLCYVKRDGYTLMVYRNKASYDIFASETNWHFFQKHSLQSSILVMYARSKRSLATVKPMTKLSA